MFVFNLKINGNKTAKILMGVLCIIILIITFIICYRIIFNNYFKTNDDYLSKDTVYTITAQNYTNILQNVHNDIDTYVGQKIKFTGYVYRLYDFNEEQFVLARDMIISSNYQSVIVGFLCECDSAKNYSDNTWVNITGKITKGSYHGDMPIVKVTEIKTTDKPNDEYVYPPDETYIPTNGIV